MRSRRRGLLIPILLLPVLGGVALIASRGSASSASTVAPSARPAATAFAGAYVAFLNGRLAVQALPDMTAASRTQAAEGGRVPAPYRGKVVLSGVRFSGVLGAPKASVGVIARVGSRTLEATVALRYAGGHWLLTTLVPPDLSTVFAPSTPSTPSAAVPSAVRAAARSFALAYADYRTGASARPPAGLATIEHQLAAGQDPLASTARSRHTARIVRLQILPQGQLTAVDAVVAAGSRRLRFGFILQDDGGRWQASSFPVTES